MPINYSICNCLQAPSAIGKLANYMTFGYPAPGPFNKLAGPVRRYLIAVDRGISSPGMSLYSNYKEASSSQKLA